MRTTTAQLEKLHDLLTGPKIDLQRAVALLKEELVKGPCHGETTGAREACLLLVEKFLRQRVTGQREGESLLERVIRNIQHATPLNKDGLTPSVESLAAFLDQRTTDENESDADAVTPPGGFAQRLLAVLKLLGEGETWLQEEVTRLEGVGLDPPPWAEIHFMLGRLVGQEDAARAVWQREREELHAILADMTDQLSAILQQIGANGEAMGAAAQRVESAATGEMDLAKLREKLLQEARAFEKQALTMRQQAQENHSALERHQHRMEKLSQSLREQGDENLLDPVSGLPNRFALAARLKRAADRSEQIREGCALVVVEVSNLSALLQGMKSESGHKLVAALAQRVEDAVGERGYVGRLAEERFAILTREARQGEQTVASQVSQTVESLLRHTRFKSGGQVVSLQCRVGVAAHQPGMKAKAWLQAAQPVPNPAKPEQD